MLDRPNLMILGTSKAGTTSLHSYLDQHPDIFMCQPKEPYFFRSEYERGLSFYWETYFSSYHSQSFAGDAAPQHLYLPFCAKRIAETLRDPYLIVLCRNPVDRAISAYQHNARRGIEKLSFEDAVAQNLRRLEKGPRFENEDEAALYQAKRDLPGDAIHQDWQFYVDPGYYLQHIERYSNLFGRDRLFVGLFDDLVADPAAFVTRLEEFLGLEPKRPATGEALNQATSPTAAKIVDYVGSLPGANLFPAEWRQFVKNSIFRMGKSKKLTIETKTMQDLIEHYRPHNAALGSWLNRDLSHWNKASKIDDPLNETEAA